MLHPEDPRRQSRLIVIGIDGHDGLPDDRPSIEFGADKMNRTPSEPNSSGERLPLRVQAAERGEERRMNVDHPIAPSLDKARVEHTHKSGKEDEVDLPLFEQDLHLRCEGLPVAVR